MSSQLEKGAKFRALHDKPNAFIIPNPWDAGTARLLEYLGFESLATTGAGYAFSKGMEDGSLSREQMLNYAAEIAVATELPVSADLEDGYGMEPDTVAETVRMSAERGLVGGSIEDILPRRKAQLHDHDAAQERVRAAAEAAQALPFDFTLTARCENYLIGNPDLDDTIRRLCAYQEAGADVLYAPGLSTRADIDAVVRSVDRPVNVVVGLVGTPFSLADLQELGVRRVSLGSTLSRAALGAFMRAGREIRDHGTFEFAAEAMKYSEINSFLSKDDAEKGSSTP